MYINSNDKADTLRRNMKENESMKKWIVLTLALALALSLFAGCGKGADADETDYASMSIEELKPLLKTVTDGKLTVATSPDFAPYEFYSIDENENPTLAGFDIALAQYIADYLGLELEIIPWTSTVRSASSARRRSILHFPAIHLIPPVRTRWTSRKSTMLAASRL